MIVLIDCDNFFASCERAMQPSLASVPVAVLSNNDGCVIARTEEVKLAGVTMGQPFHECKDILNRIGAVTVSANFLLYRHFAKRLQTILRAVPSTAIEVYSIDESFIEVPDTSITNPEQWAATLRQTIDKWTGLPVSIGIAPSKALAKLATRLAKKSNGVCVLGYGAYEVTEKALKATQVADVWGIGRRLSPKLRLCGVVTAWDLMQLKSTDPALKLLDQPTLQLILELRGWKSSIDNTPVQRKSIMHSRSFGVRVNNINEVRSVLIDFSSQIASKLRRKKLVADRAVFSLRYRVEGKKYGDGKSIEIQFPWTNDTFDFAQIAEQAAEELFEEGKEFTKAMVWCSNLRHDQQMNLYETHEVLDKKESLMRAVDELETRYGAAGPQIATRLLRNSWQGKRQFISPYNHAEWNAIPHVMSS